MRVDTTLVGFENLKWLRGNISYMFAPNSDGDQPLPTRHPGESISQPACCAPLIRATSAAWLWARPRPDVTGGADFVLIDHDNKLYEHASAGKDDQGKIEDRVNFLMNMPVRVATPLVDKVKFEVKKSGILGTAVALRGPHGRSPARRHRP